MNFAQFKYKILLEGGSLTLTKKTGETIRSKRIDLAKIERDDIIPILKELLYTISSEFKKFTGDNLWSPEAMKELAHLSGSARHFFDLSNITTDIFKSVKKSVGDIDTMVDVSKKKELGDFLTELVTKAPNFELENSKAKVEFVGFKPTANQILTMWTIECTLKDKKTGVDYQFKSEYQIDFELVDFKNDRPDEFSRFGHSSSWEDLSIKVKGVFHKHLLRAISRVEEIPVLVPKRGEKDPVEEVIKPYTFAVDKGIRDSFKQLVDKEGNPLTGKDKSGNYRPIIKKLTSSTTDYDTHIPSIFEKLFKHPPTGEDLTDFNSFLGLLRLIKKYFKESEQIKIIKEFIYLIFHENLRLLSAEGGVKEDQSEKFTALKKMLGFFELRNNSDIIKVIKTSAKEYYSKKREELQKIEEVTDDKEL